MKRVRVAAKEGGDHVRLFVTREEIGDYLGLTIETVSRNLGKLRHLRYLDFLSVKGIDDSSLMSLSRLGVLEVLQIRDSTGPTLAGIERLRKALRGRQSFPLLESGGIGGFEGLPSALKRAEGSKTKGPGRHGTTPRVG